MFLHLWHDCVNYNCQQWMGIQFSCSTTFSTTKAARMWIRAMNFANKMVDFLQNIAHNHSAHTSFSMAFGYKRIWCCALRFITFFPCVIPNTCKFPSFSFISCDCCFVLKANSLHRLLFYRHSDGLMSQIDRNVCVLRECAHQHKPNWSFSQAQL